MQSPATAWPRACRVCLGFAAALVFISSARAATQTLVLTGDSLPGSPSAKLQGISHAAINSSGQVSFLATLQHGVGGVTAETDRAVWRTNGASGSTLARTGVGALPGGGALSAVQSIAISDGGTVLVSGAAGTAEGIWRYPAAGAGQLVASTNGSPAPDLPDATLDDLGVSVFYSTGGVAAYLGSLQLGGSVSAMNDRGVWLDDGQPSLLAREGVTPVPGVDTLGFSNMGPAAVNNASQVAMRATLPIGPGGITPGNSLGIWRLGPAQGILIARRDAGGVADVPDASYSELGDPTLNGQGEVAYRASLATSLTITEANRYGVWIHDGADSHAVARSGAQPPGVPAAVFADFGDPLLNDNGNLLVAATLAPGIGGVTSANAQGLWNLSLDGGALLARTGSGGVPGLPGASFASFGVTGFNGQDTAVVEATLATGPAGVTEANAKGLWLMQAGGSGQLLARAGDTLAGRTVADLAITGGSAGSDGRSRSLNESGQVVFKATFTNGDEGLFLFTPNVALAAADFTGDGQVNAADLQRWRTNFGAGPAASPAQGDADQDGDVDGGDLLVWQRQVNSAAVAAIPEPSFAALVLPAAILGILRLQSGDRSANRPGNRSR